jgi:putative flippase GtrA
VRAGLRRWGVFNLVGFGGFLLQIGTIACLTRVYDWPPALATAIALEVAFLHNFYGHNRWTWRERLPRRPGEWVTRLWRYQLAKAASLAGNLAVTTACASLAGLPTEVANAVAVLACALPNFVVAERLIFTSR